MKCPNCGEEIGEPKKDKETGEGEDPKYSKDAEKVVGAKMHKLAHEGKKRPQNQMIAIALSEARRSGFRVPTKK